MKLPSKIIFTLFILFASKLVIANPVEAVKDATQAWADAFNSRVIENILVRYSAEALFWGTVSPTLRDNPAEVRDYFEVIGPDASVLLGDQRPRVFGDIAVNTGHYQFTDIRDGKKDSRRCEV